MSTGLVATQPPPTTPLFHVFTQSPLFCGSAERGQTETKTNNKDSSKVTSTLLHLRHAALSHLLYILLNSLCLHLQLLK